MEGRNNPYTMSWIFKKSGAIIHDGCIGAAFNPHTAVIPVNTKAANIYDNSTLNRTDFDIIKTIQNIWF